MSETKAALTILCKIFNFLLNENLTPEYFRLAKFNNDDVVSIFWNFLYKCCNHKYDNTNIVQNVKLYFASLNYKNVNFYCLPEDLSTGSRELLISLAWLIGEHDIIHKLLQTELSKSNINKEFELNIHNNTPIDKYKKNINTIRDYFNYIMFLSGKINNNLKCTSEINERIPQLMIKVKHQISTTKRIPPLSIIELNYLKNQGDLNLYLRQTENISKMLEDYYTWQSKEKYFWEWMDTVLKESKISKVTASNEESFHLFYKVLREHLKITLLKEKVEMNSPPNIDRDNRKNKRWMISKSADNSESKNFNKKYLKALKHFETESSEILSSFLNELMNVSIN